MKEYIRNYPLFSLCGLNCGLCPRFQSVGESRCPGCGGRDFHLKHPSCVVITCSKKHNNIEYCFLCERFPCQKYKFPSGKDSFITYQNVLKDMQRALDIGIDRYKKELDEKVEFLEHLISHYNDGKRKSFYCIAVNLLELSDLKEINEYIQENISEKPLSQKEKIQMIESLFMEKAKDKNIDLQLRK